ncbi:hypothetical protein PYW08_012976 [Mythimna loreyi]|uniref:Uncharacterized protein n=1 Tax=Mythimna loreyi TaxID=667449 RepID=A0ACC2PZZ4_9NEOP|nr:hypothetical protein PYW08_012976 [Mythimna loreyi]
MSTSHGVRVGEKGERLWQELVEVLNSMAGGVIKPLIKWKKVWTDWKTKTKKKSLAIRREASGTGGGPSSRQILTALEERVLGIMDCTIRAKLATTINQRYSLSIPNFCHRPNYGIYTFISYSSNNSIYCPSLNSAFHSIKRYVCTDATISAGPNASAQLCRRTSSDTISVATPNAAAQHCIRTDADSVVAHCVHVAGCFAAAVAAAS